MLDCLLVSLAVSATLFTVFVLGGGAVAAVPASALDSPRPDFRLLVVHTSVSCPALQAPAGCHFLVDRDGEVQPTIRWRRGEPVRATAHEGVNRHAVAVALEPEGDPARQREGLRDVIERFMGAYPGIESRVVSHARVDRSACGEAYSR
jgi:hypothetical protein